MEEATLPFKGHVGWILTLAYSPDGTFLATGSSDHTIRIWEAATGRQVRGALKGHTDIANSITYSPNGQHLVGGSSDQSLCV